MAAARTLNPNIISVVRSFLAPSIISTTAAHRPFHLIRPALGSRRPLIINPRTTPPTFLTKIYHFTCLSSTFNGSFTVASQRAGPDHSDDCRPSWHIWLIATSLRPEIGKLSVRSLFNGRGLIRISGFKSTLSCQYTSSPTLHALPICYHHFAHTETNSSKTGIVATC